QNLETHRDRFSDVQRPAVQRVGQRFTLEQLHRDEGPGRVFADFVDLAEVRVIDAGRGARFTPQALARSLVAGKRRQCLEGDRTLEPFVTCFVDDAHATLAQLAPDGVVAEAHGLWRSVRGLRRLW